MTISGRGHWQLVECRPDSRLRGYRLFGGYANGGGSHIPSLADVMGTDGLTGRLGAAGDVGRQECDCAQDEDFSLMFVALSI
jgi:hypothetical protein